MIFCLTLILCSVAKGTIAEQVAGLRNVPVDSFARGSGLPTAQALAHNDIPGHTAPVRRHLLVKSVVDLLNNSNNSALVLLKLLARNNDPVPFTANWLGARGDNVTVVRHAGQGQFPHLMANYHSDEALRALQAIAEQKATTRNAKK
jgi:hypothetical protein